MTKGNAVAEPKTNLSRGNLDFIDACVNGLVAFSAKWTIGPVKPKVSMQISVNAAMLFRDADDENAEMAVAFLHQGTSFLVIGCSGNKQNWQDAISFAFIRPGVGGNDEPIWGTHCSAGDIPEIIRIALEKHLQRKAKEGARALDENADLLKKFKLLKRPTDRGRGRVARDAAFFEDLNS